MNDIVKQAATAAGRQALQIGFTLASQAILGNPTRDIIDKLNAINAKLDGISTRIDTLTSLANQLLGEQRLQFFQAELRELCSYATDQKLVYSLYYMPMVRAAKALADSSSPDSWPTDCPYPDPDKGRCLTPREIAKATRDRFVKTYGDNALALKAEIEKIHTALMPGLHSVLGALGLTLMSSRRFLNADRSHELPALYAELHEVEGLASWMATEYWVSQASQETSPYTFEKMISDYTENTSDEQAALPPMIPDGAVIDLTRVNATTTDGKADVAPTDGR